MKTTTEKGKDMSIENDVSLWPEGAQFYIKPKEGDHPTFFAKTKIDHPDFFDGIDVGGKYYVFYAAYWEAVHRPPANQGGQTLPWPQVGVECEYSYDGGDSWRVCKILAVHAEHFWVVSGGEPFTVASKDGSKFRPIRTLRDDAIRVVELALSEAYSDGPASDRISSDTDQQIYAAAAVDALMAKYDLKEKTQ